MPISVECRTCNAKLKVKDELAGRQVRCPHCKMGIAIPKPAAQSDLELEDDLDFGGLDLAPPVPSRSSKKSRPAARGEDELEFLDDGDDDLPREEVLLSKLPPKRKKKKTVKVEEDREPIRVGGRGDVLVWVLLLAMIPLGVSIFLPEVPLEQRVQKTVAKHPDMAEDFEEYGAQDFMDMHRDLTLEGAHLDRRSLIHWLYALLATVMFLLLMNAMRHETTVTPWGLLLTGFLTGTVGIALLLAFQVFAEISLHLRVFPGGIVGLIFLVIKFIGFSYRSALDPNSGFLWSFVGFTCGVGFCEEICKAIPVFYYLRNTRSSDWRGTCLLGFASGAGFGISEGIMYSGSYYNGIEPGTAYIVRFASCVALHAILSGGVALLMFGNQDYIDGDNDWGTFLWGGMQYILIAMLLHGLYDTLLKQHLNAVAFLISLGAFGWLAWLSRYYWDYEPPPKVEGIIY